MIVIPGLAAKLKKFADVDEGNGRVFYTQRPDMGKPYLEFELTGKIFILYDPQTDILTVGRKHPNKKFGTVFLVSPSDEILCYDDAIDPTAIMAGAEVDGTIKYKVTQVSPENVEAYIKCEAPKIADDLEKCGVEKRGSDSKGR